MTDYEVGHRKPPKHSRFQKGTSGNPRGRPKRSAETLEDSFQNLLNTKIEVRIKGRIRRISMLEAIIRGVVRDAVKGDVPSAALLLKYILHAEKHRDYGPITITIENALPREIN